ncbi:MAG TPA: Gfo/Idh/MocA family oxidoreductase [Planctomycetota bacterium]|nr:Gfo/Idh/MocA family oxidoreductase [Planctomycetota bacterium]
MSKRVTVAVVAIGGYGQGYLRTLLEPENREIAEIVAAVDPTPERCPYLDEFKALTVPICATMEEYVARASAPADLVVISSPIHAHAPQTIAALEHGSNVLCEKPMCATVQEADAVIAARDRAGKFVSIGYQGSFTSATHALKADVRSGVLGKPVRLRTLCLWARTERYYTRNNWAGMRKTPDGAWVLDSPANNAMSHSLHHMFYLLGDRANTSARPARVVAELYRANAITNFDTCAIRAFTDTDVEVLFVASHAVEDRNTTEHIFEFERATVTRGAEHGEIVATFTDGRTKTYPDAAEHYRHPGKLLDAIERVRTGKPDVCGPEAARAQTLVINAAADACPDITTFPSTMIVVTGEAGDRLTHVVGLEAMLRRCFDEGKLPSQTGFDWAKAGREVDLTNYTHFPGGKP